VLWFFIVAARVEPRRDVHQLQRGHRLAHPVRLPALDSAIVGFTTALVTVALASATCGGGAAILLGAFAARLRRPPLQRGRP